MLCVDPFPNPHRNSHRYKYICINVAAPFLVFMGLLKIDISLRHIDQRFLRILLYDNRLILLVVYFHLELLQNLG